MIEEQLMNATKNLLTEELLPQVSLKLNDDMEELINAKDAKITRLEDKVEQLEGHNDAKDVKIKRLDDKVELLEEHNDAKEVKINRLLEHNIRLQQQVDVINPIYNTKIICVSVCPPRISEV